MVNLWHFPLKAIRSEIIIRISLNNIYNKIREELNVELTIANHLG